MIDERTPGKYLLQQNCHMTTVQIQFGLSGSSGRRSESAVVAAQYVKKTTSRPTRQPYSRTQQQMEDRSLQKSHSLTFLCPPPFHFPRQQSGHFPGWKRHLLAGSTSLPKFGPSGIGVSVVGKASSKEVPSGGQVSVPEFSDVFPSYGGFWDSSKSVDIGKLTELVAPIGPVVKNAIFWELMSPSTSLVSGYIEGLNVSISSSPWVSSNRERSSGATGGNRESAVSASNKSESGRDGNAIVADSVAHP